MEGSDIAVWLFGIGAILVAGAGTWLHLCRSKDDGGSAERMETINSSKKDSKESEAKVADAVEKTKEEHAAAEEKLETLDSKLEAHRARREKLNKVLNDVRSQGNLTTKQIEDKLKENGFEISDF